MTRRTRASGPTQTWPSSLAVPVWCARRLSLPRSRPARCLSRLEKMPLDEYLAEVEKTLGKPLRRSAYDPAQMRWASQELPHSHIGGFPQKQRRLNYVGVAVPVGQITPKQMLRVAELADSYGSGEIRLTVWQNFIIPNVP